MRRMSHMLSGQTQGADEWDDYHTAPCLFFLFFLDFGSSQPALHSAGEKGGGNFRKAYGGQEFSIPKARQGR